MKRIANSIWHLPDEGEHNRQTGWVRRLDASGLATAHADDLALEVPVAMEINGISYAVMMATPSDLVDFARGFLYTERIIDHLGELYDVDIHHGEHGVTLHIQLATAAWMRLKHKRRSLLGVSGCGVCGIESLQQLQSDMGGFRQPETMQDQRAADDLTTVVLNTALQQLETRQTLRQATGATHAAAWASWSGVIETVREDVGRHNALDKLIGALLLQSRAPDSGWILVSSRASFEMVHKTAVWGGVCLASVSAATAQAVEWARLRQIRLYGFARPNRAVCYV